jgi:hypothetical protein
MNLYLITKDKITEQIRKKEYEENFMSMKIVMLKLHNWYKIVNKSTIRVFINRSETRVLWSYQTLQMSGYHFCFVSSRSWVQILGWRPAILRNHVFSQSLQEYWNSTLKQTITTSFNILPNTPFINHSTMWCYLTYAAGITNSMEQNPS